MMSFDVNFVIINYCYLEFFFVIFMWKTYDIISSFQNNAVNVFKMKPLINFKKLLYLYNF